MTKIKLTKSELKSQRDSLKMFRRYLPTLQLKKQQLQMEVRRAQDEFRQLREQEEELVESIRSWSSIVDEDSHEPLFDLMSLESIQRGSRNIAGIDTPELQELKFGEAVFDLFETPLWYEDAIKAMRKLVEFGVRKQLLQEKLDLLEQELRTTTQRVNLFEKVKIPEARENIRRIQIYLGDQQASAVGRAKIAKGKCAERDAQHTMEVAV